MNNEFGLIKSFGIDNEELESVTREESFVLGYELAMIDNALKLPKAFSQMVHSDNAHRIRQSCSDSGRTFQLHWTDNDPSEMWMMLHVAALDEE